MEFMDTPENVSLALLPVSNEAEGEMAGEAEVPVAAAGGGLPMNCFFIVQCCLIRFVVLFIVFDMEYVERTWRLTQIDGWNVLVTTLVSRRRGPFSRMDLSSGDGEVLLGSRYSKVNNNA